MLHPIPTSMIYGGDDDTFETRVGKRVQIQPNGCWYYGRNPNPDKYVRIKLPSGEMVPGHRWFWETLVAPITQGLHLHHRCEHPGCVCPGHMELLTASQHRLEHNDLRRERGLPLRTPKAG